MARRALALCLMAAAACTASAGNITSIFEFEDLVDIEGHSTSLAQYKGNVTLVINVASF